MAFLILLKAFTLSACFKESSYSLKIHGSQLQDYNVKQLLRNKLQISFLILTWILAVENLRFSDDFKRNRSLLIRSKLLNNKSKICRRYSTPYSHLTDTKKKQKPIFHLTFYKISLNKIRKQRYHTRNKIKFSFPIPCPLNWWYRIMVLRLPILHIFTCLCLYMSFIWITLFKVGSCIQYVCKIFQKTNISYSPIRVRTRVCTYQGVRNLSFSGTFVYIING